MHVMAKCKLVPSTAALMRIARGAAELNCNADGSLEGDLN
jgi:hypothetical protein